MQSFRTATKLLSSLEELRGKGGNGRGGREGGKGEGERERGEGERKKGRWDRMRDSKLQFSVFLKLGKIRGGGGRRDK